MLLWLFGGLFYVNSLFERELNSLKHSKIVSVYDQEIPQSQTADMIINISIIYLSRG